VDLEFPINETFEKREPAVAELSPKPRFPSSALLEDDLPNWRLSKFDIAREGDVADPVARDEFIGAELCASAPPEAASVVPREGEAAELPPNECIVSLPPLDVVAEPVVGLPVFLATAGPAAFAEPVEFPNPCHWPSAIAGCAFDRAALPLVPRDAAAE
jgi:hypothetical protein